MTKGSNTKRIPARIGIFGANSRIGGAVARAVAECAPDVALTLIVRNEACVPELGAAYPSADHVVADYYDLPSLERALRDVESLFVVTPDFLDEERAMTLLVQAIRTQPGLLHIVRLLADPPGMTMDRIPDGLKRYGGGTAVQHLRAKRLLEASGLPFTYVNIAAYYMQNFTMHLGVPVKSDRTLAVPRDRRVAFIDAADVGACVAALLLSDNQRHIGQTYHLDNGHDTLWFSDVAAMMSDVFGEPIRYDCTDEAYRRLAGDAVVKRFKRPDAVDYFLQYFQFEQDNETVWRKTDIVEFLTGRPATTLREFLERNKNAILG